MTGTAWGGDVARQPLRYVLRGMLLGGLLMLLSAGQLQAEGGGCHQAAQGWLATMPAESRELLERQTLASCQTSGDWLARYGRGELGRKRTCNDLVLVWTHKKCIYFRDDVTAVAYAPCKEWSRQMYERCLAGDLEWFER